MSSHLVHKHKCPGFRCIYQTAGVHFVDRWQHGTINGDGETSKSDPSGLWLIFSHNNNFDLRVLDPKCSEFKMIIYEGLELKKGGGGSMFHFLHYLPNKQ